MIGKTPANQRLDQCGPGPGLETAGVKVVSAGVITTPGVAYLTRANQFAAGIVISASHNPWQDNGIKIFGADGYKLSDQLEHEIEADIFPTGAVGGEGRHLTPWDMCRHMLPGEAKLREQYAQWLAGFVAATDFGKLRVLVDCANGAASAARAHGISPLRNCRRLPPHRARWPQHQCRLRRALSRARCPRRGRGPNG